MCRVLYGDVRTDPLKTALCNQDEVSEAALDVLVSRERLLRLVEQDIVPRIDILALSGTSTVIGNNFFRSITDATAVARLALQASQRSSWAVEMRDEGGKGRAGRVSIWPLG